jgi:hypothetical protein
MLAAMIVGAAMLFFLGAAFGAVWMTVGIVRGDQLSCRPT